MDIISNPHGTYFKSTFGQIEMAKDFIENYLPGELKEIISIDTLSHESNSFLNEELKNQFADLVYKAEIKGLFMTLAERLMEKGMEKGRGNKKGTIKLKVERKG